jgi:hypothetical protein
VTTFTPDDADLVHKRRPPPNAPAADHGYVSPSFVADIRRAQVSTLTPEPVTPAADKPAKAMVPPPPKRVGKSIHGLVEIGAPDAAAWRLAKDKLLYAVANPYAPASHRADRACRNPDRLTRLAGATRPDKGTAQSLLWLASP